MRLTPIARGWLKKRLQPEPPNQKPGSLWQDPVFGYFETHGKTEFKPGEEYDLTEEQKKAVLERYYKKEKLKQEFLALQYNPQRFNYIEGVITDPALFRWYATDMSHTERFRTTPKTAFVLVASILFLWWFYNRAATRPRLVFEEKCYKGEYLWWDRSNRWWTESVPGRATVGEM